MLAITNILYYLAPAGILLISVIAKNVGGNTICYLALFDLRRNDVDDIRGF